MKCPKCGTENKTKFCVGCGSNMEKPDELTIEQITPGGYRSEEEFDDVNNNFKIAGGTFTITDKAPQATSVFFSAEDLNQSDEEDEIQPIPTTPNNIPTNVPQPAQTMPYQQTFPPMQQGYPNPIQNTAYPVPPQPQQGFYPPPLQQDPYANNMQQPNINNPYMQQGYPMGMYGQPMQPQIIGYDVNGMPIYAQVPMMQPQFMGYDVNGNPVYSQPMPMYMPPNMYIDSSGQMIQSNGIPPQGIMPQSMPPQGVMPQGMPPQGVMPQSMPPQGVMPQSMPPQGVMPQSMPPQGVMPQGTPPQVVMPQGMPPQGVMPNNTPAPENNHENKEPTSNGFFDDNEKDDDEDDVFFGKIKSKPTTDDSLQKKTVKKVDKEYMNTVPEVDADSITPNKSNNKKKYMNDTGVVNADDLIEKTVKKSRVKMGATDNAVDTTNVENLEYFPKKKKTVMQFTDSVNAEDLDVFEKVKTKSVMSDADKAVEALPKKKKYVDDLDLIELPEYMTAKKTVVKNDIGVPELPDTAI